MNKKLLAALGIIFLVAILTASTTINGVRIISGDLTVQGTTTLANGAALGSPASIVLPSSATGTTQTAADNSTKIATTAYADATRLTTCSANLSGSKSFATVYQNTSTKAMFVSVMANAGSAGLTSMETDSSNPPTDTVSYGTYNSGSAAATYGWVQAGWFYKITNGVSAGGAGAILKWHECQ